MLRVCREFLVRSNAGSMTAAVILPDPLPEPPILSHSQIPSQGSMVSEGYDYKYFTNMANHLFCKVKGTAPVGFNG